MKLLDSKTEAKKMKHFFQNASIIGHMMEKNLIEEKFCYIEMGAGRGSLGTTLSLSFPFVKLFLIDNNKPRNAGDKDLKKIGRAPFRAKIDIRDLEIAKLPLPSNKLPVILAKHLCGVGTDYALRSILTSETGIGGVAIATCCHHCVDFNDYVNTNFLSKMGFEKDDLPALGRLGGWATSYSNSNEKVGANEKFEIGSRAKWLIDYGRVLFLKELGYKAELVQFCQTELSPENRLILA
eukprot:CAMPEP_0171456436 /NCGR_PEP_ID=MMETSP0945-20130129/2920_1 /TAXON_ID=109269 /ORGANISM="Vaucheria litorea, Strain CCMP2940" /LENGTH=237 /DNA_ID=CAMNT_0011981853 /DNA_START=448 /DNA_END=1158 /DNA_ORIENTATION=-